MTDIGLTHIALEVSDLDASITFYATFAKMQVVHRRANVVWLSDNTRPFVIVLIETDRIESPLRPPAHLGVACATLAGDPGDQLYVIQSGEIELTREGSSGHRVVAHLGPGDFFGELSAVAGQRRSTRAVAVKQTRVLELDRATLEAMCLAQPEIAIRMIRILVSRLIEAERRLAMLGVDDLLRPLVALDAFAREDLDVDHGPRHAGLWGRQAVNGHGELHGCGADGMRPVSQYRL